MCYLFFLEGLSLYSWWAQNLYQNIISSVKSFLDIQFMAFFLCLYNNWCIAQLGLYHTEMQPVVIAESNLDELWSSFEGKELVLAQISSKCLWRRQMDDGSDVKAWDEAEAGKVWNQSIEWQECCGLVRHKKPTWVSILGTPLRQTQFLPWYRGGNQDSDQGNN